MTLTRMLYAARCYWAGVTPANLDHIANRAAATGLDPGTGTGRRDQRALPRAVTGEPDEGLLREFAPQVVAALVSANAKAPCCVAQP